MEKVFAKEKCVSDSLSSESEFLVVGDKYDRFSL